MWDLIVSVPDHCLSFYFTKSDVNILSFYRPLTVRQPLATEIIYITDQLISIQLALFIPILQAWEINAKWQN